jgi:hypothetical protein
MVLLVVHGGFLHICTFWLPVVLPRVVVTIQMEHVLFVQYLPYLVGPGGLVLLLNIMLCRQHRRVLYVD